MLQPLLCEFTPPTRQCDRVVTHDWAMEVPVRTVLPAIDVEFADQAKLSLKLRDSIEIDAPRQGVGSRHRVEAVKFGDTVRWTMPDRPRDAAPCE